MVRYPMTVAEVIKELETWPQDAILRAGPNDPKHGSMQCIIAVNYTYKWLLTEMVGINGDPLSSYGGRSVMTEERKK